jgi:hypothetical protein
MGSNDQPLRFSTRFLFSVAGDDENRIKNDLDIIVDLDIATVDLVAMLKVVNSRLLGFAGLQLFLLLCWTQEAVVWEIQISQRHWQKMMHQLLVLISMSVALNARIPGSFTWWNSYQPMRHKMGLQLLLILCLSLQLPS